MTYGSVTGYPAEAVIEDLGDATYIHITGATGIPDGVHQTEIGPRPVRLYVNAAWPAPSTSKREGT